MYLGLFFLASLIFTVGLQVFRWHRSRDLRPKLEKILGAPPRIGALAEGPMGQIDACRGRFRGRELTVDLMVQEGGAISVRSIRVALSEPSSRFKLIPRDFGAKLYQRLQKAEPEDAFKREIQTFPAKAEARLTDARLRSWLARQAQTQGFQHLRVEDAALVAGLNLNGPSFATVKGWIVGLCDLADFLDPKGGLSIIKAPAAPVTRTKTASRQGALRCPFCRDDLAEDDEVKACPSCDTRHHAECFAEARGCTILGCGGGRSARARVTNQARP